MIAAEVLHLVSPLESLKWIARDLITIIIYLSLSLTIVQIPSCISITWHVVNYEYPISYVGMKKLQYSTEL